MSQLVVRDGKIIEQWYNIQNSWNKKGFIIMELYTRQYEEMVVDTVS